VKSLEFDPRAFEDLKWWIQQDRKIALRIMRLVENVQETPFEGLGKREPLKHELKRLWSRRIEQEHRLIYQVQGDKIRILACRFHYS
jgi:toxin YoeB